MISRRPFEQNIIAISVSESPDMAVLGLSNQHLQDAMAEIARHLLALGAKLAYGGDLRTGGFTKLLFELVTRHQRDADNSDQTANIKSYLSWPLYSTLTYHQIQAIREELTDIAELILLGQDGIPIDLKEDFTPIERQATDDEWTRSLTHMRETLTANTEARIVLGGRTEKYKGCMPGIAEEVLHSLQEEKPIFLLGGFGGCAQDIAETMAIIEPTTISSTREWANREKFNSYNIGSLKNGLNEEENIILAKTIHINQAIVLILRGLFRLSLTHGSAKEI